MTHGLRSFLPEKKRELIGQVCGHLKQLAMLLSLKKSKQNFTIYRELRDFN